MENKMLAVEDTMKVEVGEVKVETADVDNGLFGAAQITWGFAIKDDTDKIKDEIDLNRIKNEHNFDEAWRNKEVLEMHDEKIKREELNASEITEELIIKNENDSDDSRDTSSEKVLNSAPKLKISREKHQHLNTGDSYRLSTCAHCNATYKHKLSLNDHIIRKHPEFIASISRKIHGCSYCSYKTTMKNCLVRHMLKHSETADRYKHRCVCCDKKFKSKTSLDDHTIRKHPDFIASVSSKIHQCAQCTYKTTIRNSFARHMLKHAKSADQLNTCIHCNATFKYKHFLDEHIVKKHPDFIASVSSKIHRCTQCTYKTTRKNGFDRHMLKHSESADIFYDTAFTTTSRSRKMHECIHCIYKTTSKHYFARHMLKHAETPDKSKVNMCMHCNAFFKSKQGLDDHVIRKHLDTIDSVYSKIYECTFCAYKTIMKTSLANHMLKHPEVADSYTRNTSTRCNATFTRKLHHDDHTVRKHPGSISSISSEIYQCTYCTYKTTMKCDIDRHMMKHSETADSSIRLYTCIHCDKRFVSKRSLDDHTIGKHPDFIASITSKIYECTHCTYKTTKRYVFSTHMLKHSETVHRIELRICNHCDETFRNKRTLDNHTIREHPDFIASVSSKIHECTHCTYKTTVKSSFTDHLSTHPEISESCKLSIPCSRCNATFRRKTILDEHTVKEHPDFIASVSCKIHECTHCTFKTTVKKKFTDHMVNHSKPADNFKVIMCIHCNATFKSKCTLDDHTIKKHSDFITSVSSKIRECAHCTYKTTMKLKLDEHIIRKHPDFIASVSSKMYECTHCTYKTTNRRNFAGHMSKHPEIADSYELNITCIHCNASFKSETALDDHTIRKHPDFIASVSSKIYKCTYCTYKTTNRRNFACHMSKHKFSTTCIHCNASFQSKRALDEHTIRKHPDFIASVSSKIYKCAHCAYKSVIKLILDEHIIRKHPDFIACVSSKIHECTHCTYKTANKSNFTGHMSSHL